MYPGSKKLRLGLLLDSMDVPAWFFHSLEQIVNSAFAEFILVILNDVDETDKNLSQPTRPGANSSISLYKLFNQIDERIFIREPDASQPKNLQELLVDATTISIKSIRNGEKDNSNTDSVQEIRNSGLDIIIHYGPIKPVGEIITAAKYGIWFHRHSDNRELRGDPPGFWEVIERKPQTIATLSIADCKHPNGRIIFQACFSTHPFSPAKNRNKSFWASSSFLPRQIEHLAHLGELRFFSNSAKYHSGFDLYDYKQYPYPSNFIAIKCYFGLFIRIFRELFQRLLLRDTWYLMFGHSNNLALSFGNFKKIVPPTDRFWADPHVVQIDDDYFIFVEEYIYKQGKGHISVIEMNSSGVYKEPVPILEKDYHLSYPFVFEYENRYFMVPESSQNRTIDLYECVEFPDVWKFKMNLMQDVRAKDTTLFFDQGKWWLFTGITESEGANPEVELNLFFSESLFTTAWKSHPLNPVISDATCARPAGKLFVKDHKVYRPSQDCSRNYGYGFVINEVECLDEENYLEKKVEVVKPNWDSKVIASHTFTIEGDLIVIDAFIRRRKIF